MAKRTIHYRWQWRFAARPQALWPLVADTNRFNRDSGLPVVQGDPALPPSRHSGRRPLRLRVWGLTAAWDEAPFEWVYPERFGVVRRYSSGPLAELRVGVRLSPTPDGGTELTYELDARPANWLGRLVIPVQIGLLSARRFAAAFKRYGQIAATSTAAMPPPVAAVRFAPGGRERLSRMSERLAADAAPAGLVDRLTRLVAEADDLDVSRMRPYAMADAWGEPRRSVLELCLRATRAGLLHFRWDLLCPLCRGVKQTSDRLGGVRSRVHCDACHIDFDVDFDRLVELTFRPNPAVREIETREYCMGGPRVTPHVVVQQLVPAGKTWAIRATLEPGRHRMRRLDVAGGDFIVVADEGAAAARFAVEPKGGIGEMQLSPAAEITLANDSDHEQLFMLERMAWTDQAATAAEVTMLQVFRDLFSSEALRPGERISVGSLAILFTDLRDSTRLYREVGDAPAFGRVMSHFDVLREAIAANDGALVKTMGDAVMGVFRRPVAAMQAVLEAQRKLNGQGHSRRRLNGQSESQQRLKEQDESQKPLCLKAGIHYGPCIAVTLNDRLDYFGSTVNVAARLVSLSAGGDAVISGAVRDDPEVAAMMGQATAITVAEISATLKGFEGEAFSLFRVTPSDGAKPEALVADAHAPKEQVGQ